MWLLGGEIKYLVILFRRNLTQYLINLRHASIKQKRVTNSKVFVFAHK